MEILQFAEPVTGARLCRFGLHHFRLFCGGHLLTNKVGNVVYLLPVGLLSFDMARRPRGVEREALVNEPGINVDASDVVVGDRSLVVAHPLRDLHDDTLVGHRGVNPTSCS